MVRCLSPTSKRYMSIMQQPLPSRLPSKALCWPARCLQVQLPPSHRSGNGSSSSSNPPRIISRSVLLAKHPVAHRGDVRVVTAVDPSYRPNGRLLVDHYVNMVVFSQQGDRPLPNMLSGSDLVGAGWWQQQLLVESDLYCCAASLLGWTRS